MTGIVVRPVRSSDAAALADLLNAVIARGGTTALETPYSPELLADAYLTGPDVLCCFVALDGETGRIEGFQTLCRDRDIGRDWGDIGTFSRVGGTQRGVGTALFAGTRARALELGLTGINATIRADNEGGLAFYRKMGFAEYKIDRGMPLKDGTPIDRISKRYVLHAGQDRVRSGEVVA